ncbi:endo-1,4-beta-xylanase [Amycolatopsis sp. lyj-112]|uniref:endo-1,4-beta-xylanase n=1 Tax=Amycolatopsis sp. lyj-112 TaxID=2789288 RepID=UPI00397D4AC3
MKNTIFRIRAVAVLVAVAGVTLSNVTPASAAVPLKNITHRYVGSAVAANHLANEADYRSVLTREFDNVTPENEMKWGVVEATRSHYDWSGADAIVDYARRTGKSVRGHTLVWHSQLPGWVNDLEAGELRSAVKQHIATEMGRYKGKIRAWDVVNEMFNDDGTRRSSVFQQKLGDRYVADAFRWARAADPSAKLYINDYNTEGLNAKSDALYDLVRKLKKQGVPIDGVGFQAHLATQYGFPAGYQANLARFAALGVDVAITEADVRILMPADAAKLAVQANYFKQLWDGCHAVARCVEFTTWGFTDRHSWVPDTFPSEGAACLFDTNLRAKPAYTRINP